MKQITGEMGIIWMYCPMEKNLADLGSREARINKMETGGGSQVPNGYYTRSSGWISQMLTAPQIQQ